MSASVLDWHADYSDPVPFQEEVLDWLEAHGVERPREALIESVTIARHGEGAVAEVHRLVQPLTLATINERITDRVTFDRLPPARP